MAYGLIYTIPFKTIRGDIPCVVNIEEKDYAGISTELTGGESPITIDIDDEDFLYTPSKFSTAKLNVMGSDYLINLSTTSYQQHRVTLLRNGIVQWCGFVKPETYTQDYVSQTFNLEIECISSLSTLDYIDYAKKGDTLQFVSLWYLLQKCITSANGNYVSVYIPYVYSDTSDNYAAAEKQILEDMTVSEQNFFDEDGKAMKLKEILESICKLLSWTCIDYKGSIYFVDNDHQGQYWVYNADMNAKTGNYNPNAIPVQNIGFNGSDHSLDILGGYSKASIKDSNYNVGTIFPEQKYYRVLKKIGEINNNNFTWGFQPDFVGVLGSEGDANADGYLFDSVVETYAPIYNTLNYSGNIPELSNYIGKIVSYLYLGSFIVRNAFAEYKLNQFGEAYWTTGSISYDDCIALYLKSEKAYGEQSLQNEYDLPENLDLISFKNQLPLSAYSDGCFYLTGSVAASKDKKAHTYNSICGSNTDITFIMMLKVGGYYWDGSKWVTTETKFTIKIEKDKSYTGYRNFPETKTFGMPYSSASGYVIPLPSTPIFGSPEFHMYTPTIDAEVSAIYIKDLKLTFAKSDDVQDKDDESDRLYENAVNSDYINELDQIELKITSYENDGSCYSKVIMNNDYLKDNLYSHVQGKLIRPEEALITRIINRYKNTRLKLTQQINNPDELTPITVLSDNYFPSKKFITWGGSIDVKENEFDCKMIEL